MRIAVQSSDEARLSGHFDSETGELHTVRRSRREPQSWDFQGQFTKINGSWMVFFRDEVGAFKLFYNSHFHDLSEENVCWRRIDDQTVEFIVATAMSLRVVYSSSEKALGVHLAATPFAEYEDFDFGLFVSNVMSSRERRDLIYRNG